ncbi:hypothetical protein [Robiginitalea sp.]|jgi:hypothetical protein|uniref:hypothetical protein n=1 Tax=Robiginitalea sp. TaxID=1902411 RepID=UPI003C70A185
MNAKTITAKTPEALQKALEAAAAEGFNSTLGVVFAPSGFETLPPSVAPPAAGWH